MNKKVSVIGSGMSGCFMALCLAQRGYNVDIFEERSDIRTEKKSSGRSFNITLYTRGILAFKNFGIWSAIKPIATLTKGNVAHYPNNRNIYDPYDAHDSEVLYTVHRNKLNSKLLNIVEKTPGIKLHFNTKLIQIDKKDKKITLLDIKTKKKKSLKTDLVVGADGVNSTVRQIINNYKSENEIKKNEEWGYKEVPISPLKATKMKLKANATQTWPRKSSLFIAFPNPDKSFTLMINLPLKGENSFETLNDTKNIKTFISQNFPDLLPVLSEITNSFLKNQTGYFTTVITKPWSYKDFIILIGDSAHCVIPFYGQGVCAALEDCIQVCELMDKNKNRWDLAFKKFEDRRKIDTDTLSVLAKENFIELRDKSRIPFFIIKDKLGTILNKAFPKLWLPSLYVLVAHGTENYDKAYKMHKRQQKIAKIIGLDLIVGLLTIPWILQIEIVRLLSKSKTK